MIELESGKTRISAPAHPSATGIGRVSGLVFISICLSVYLPSFLPSFFASFFLFLLPLFLLSFFSILLSVCSFLPASWSAINLFVRLCLIGFVVNKHGQRKQQKKNTIELSSNLERGRERRILALAKAWLESQEKNESNGMVYKIFHICVGR